LEITDYKLQIRVWAFTITNNMLEISNRQLEFEHLQLQIQILGLPITNKSLGISYYQ